jgi:hypothetical protein
MSVDIAKTESDRINDQGKLQQSTSELVATKTIPAQGNKWINSQASRERNP